MKISILAWCPQNMQNSTVPGKSAQVTKFQPITAQHDKANPNGAHFTGAEAAGYLELTNLTPEIAGQIKAGEKFKITIESIE